MYDTDFCVEVTVCRPTRYSSTPCFFPLSSLSPRPSSLLVQLEGSAAKTCWRPLPVVNPASMQVPLRQIKCRLSRTTYIKIAAAAATSARYTRPLTMRTSYCYNSSRMFLEPIQPPLCTNCHINSNSSAILAISNAARPATNIVRGQCEPQVPIRTTKTVAGAVWALTQAIATRQRWRQQGDGSKMTTTFSPARAPTSYSPTTTTN
ncbi:hypothetical protein EDB89DRAFT_1631139 [Lactarius sanguifluus]|nr:hypothetical protein EDB89DRAFT_678160 [Lactarius sanguifluus]KAH9168142.1 hypothetical protein EDB89DRAFT_1631139 [Lactarius sanguifluus]